MHERDVNLMQKRCKLTLLTNLLTHTHNKLHNYLHTRFKFNILACLYITHIITLYHYKYHIL